MTPDDKRLIEDFLPIGKISEQASREKSVRKGHIASLHLWWARRPLVACRAAVYGALVPSSRFVPANGPAEKRASLGRANAARFVERLCKYPGDPRVIAEAERHILEAHAERLTQERGEPVTPEDIVAGRAPRPKVLDMFAGGGAIPLEALRLGCEAYALDLNPVAHIIELCTLVYPQKYGRPDSTAKGSAKDGTWAGLSEEVRHWGHWVLRRVKAEIGDLYPLIPYPLIPDPEFKSKRALATGDLFPGGEEAAPPGYLVPVAYLWTRTVVCKNPACRATVPLVRQTWLCRKKDRFVALEVVTPRNAKRVRFEVVEARTAKGLGFDPEAGSKRGNAVCPFCGTVADNEHVKGEGWAGRLGQQLMALVCTRPDAKGKVYLAADTLPHVIPDDEAIRRRIEETSRSTAITVPAEPMPKVGTLGFRVQAYGVKTWGDLFTPRQMLCLLSVVVAIHDVEGKLTVAGYDADGRRAVCTYLALIVDRIAMFGNAFCAWYYQEQAVSGLFSRQALPMLWDFAEVSLEADISGGVRGGLVRVLDAIDSASATGPGAIVMRSPAQALPVDTGAIDAVIIDPPYYDNVPYADLSDFFYVWLKRAVGDLHGEHFASPLTPKKQEAIAEPARHDGNRTKANREYEQMLVEALSEAHRVLKPGGRLVVVYAHKTTLGWSTLVEALRQSGFVVLEAWPMDTEGPGRLRAHDSAALASSIFLIGSRREGEQRGRYDDDVRPELQSTVRDRVAELWDLGVSGANLVIACVGAGLRAFTRFARVEYANGEEVPAARFLTEVETVVLESILGRLSREVSGGTNLAGLDAPTRCYILWRYTYHAAELDAGEAIVFANGTHVELEGPGGLSSGPRALVEKKKAKYRLRDYADRGDDARLGLPSEDGQPAPLIDALHRTLWLMEHQHGKLADFLREAQPSREQMRLVAQALAGPALKGGELADVSPSREQGALARLTANWRSVVEDAATTVAERADARSGQERLGLGKAPAG